MQKLEMVGVLYATGIRLKAAGLRMRHPDWTWERAEFEARKALLYAGT